MNTADKLFLLDAYALIYRAYYAFIKNPRINSKGFNTSAIMGFVNTLEEVLKKENPTHIGVAFDPAGPTFRHEAYADYKAQREETPETIRLSASPSPSSRTSYRPIASPFWKCPATKPMTSSAHWPRKRAAKASRPTC